MTDKGVRGRSGPSWHAWSQGLFAPRDAQVFSGMHPSSFASCCCRKCNRSDLTTKVPPVNGAVGDSGLRQDDITGTFARKINGPIYAVGSVGGIA